MDTTLLETVPGLIYRVRATPPYDVEFVSDELASLTGYSAEQFMGPDPEVRWTDLVHPDDLPRAYEVIERALAGDLPELEFRYRRPDGSDGWMLTRARKLNGLDGSPWLHGAAIDVTERHNSEELRGLDEARRKLARDLHDGAQQRLVSASMLLSHAQRRLADPRRAGALLAEAKEELDAGLAEMRELGRGVHPAILTERGLAAALEALAARCTVPVRLRIAVPERIPARLETTAYFVVAESLTNVAKHANAAAAEVRVTLDPGRLEVVVSDDGVGGARLDAGSGLRGLADRVETHGGRLLVRSDAGRGTSVTAELPL